MERDSERGERKRPRFGLLPRVITAIALGVVLGRVVPAGAVRGFATFNALFDQFLKFFVPLIILGLVAPAIAETGRGAGRMLVATVGMAYASTVLAGFFAFGVASIFFPGLAASGGTASAAGAFAPYFTVEIPPVLGVMSALVLSFILGIGMVVSNSNVIKLAFLEFKSVVSSTISAVIIPLLPLYIFGVFLSMAASGAAWAMLATFSRVIVVIFAATFVLLLMQFAIAGAVARRNPLKALCGMAPAYATALGTSSSAATIPVTLACAVRNGVRGEIAEFAVPLCATVHLSGSMLKITACAAALVAMKGQTPDIGAFAGFIMLLGVVMVAAPGVPGGAIMSALGVLQSVLGFGESDQAMMISLYIAMDSFGTACNVTGDGAIAMAVDSIFRRKKE